MERQTGGTNVKDSLSRLRPRSRSAPLSAGPAIAADPDAALAAMKTKVFSHGPNGEKPSAASTVKLTRRRTRQGQGQARERGAGVPLCRQRLVAGSGSDALKAQFKAEGIEVIAITDAGFKPEKQVADIETVMAQKARHHRLDPRRPRRHRRRLQGRRRQGRQTGVHGQRAQGFHRGQRLCQLRFGRQLRQRRRRRASDGQGARREGRDRARVPCRGLLRHQAAL